MKINAYSMAIAHSKLHDIPFDVFVAINNN